MSVIAGKVKLTMTCHDCQTRCHRHGKDRHGAQRFRCVLCSKTYTEGRPSFLKDRRIPASKVIDVLNCLVEGVGIRSTSRLTGLHKGTVMSILLEAGERCARFLDERVRDVRCNFLEIDELWSFIHTKQRHLHPFDPPQWGDAYVFYGIDMETKLIVSHRFGRRDGVTAYDFLCDLAHRIKGRTQLTSDAFTAYEGAVHDSFFGRVDYCQLQKIFGSDIGEVREGYLPSRLVALVKETIIGEPDEELATTAHIERCNLSIRTALARYTRLSLKFSKKLENLKAAVAVWMAHYNFCKVHSAIRVTPAMEAKLTSHIWGISEILEMA